MLDDALHCIVCNVYTMQYFIHCIHRVYLLSITFINTSLERRILRTKIGRGRGRKMELEKDRGRVKKIEL